MNARVLMETKSSRRFPSAMHTRLRSFLCLLGLVAGLQAAETGRPATPDEISLFKAALKNTTVDADRWAYTETVRKKVGFGKGADGDETVVRFDPSKPWPDQYTPLKVDGKAPSRKQLKQYRERGEKRGQRMTRSAARAAEAAAADPTLPAAPEPPRRKTKELKADMEHPRVVSDQDGQIVFEVPLISTAKEIPADKFEVRAVIDKATRQVRHASVRIVESFRVKLVAKVKPGEASIDFAVVDPQYGPVMVSATGTFGGSLAFVPLNAVFSTQRTDWQRVKPYNERLQVKIGPLELLDF